MMGQSIKLIQLKGRICIHLYKLQIIAEKKISIDRRAKTQEISTRVGGAQKKPGMLSCLKLPKKPKIH